MPEIVEEEAKVVRYIYRLCLEGKTPHNIAKLLTEEGIPTPSGKTRWQQTTVESILTNAKERLMRLPPKSPNETAEKSR